MVHWRRMAAIGVAVAAAAGVLTQVGIGASTAVGTVICNKQCDGYDAAKAARDRSPVKSTLHGRTFTVHIDDTNSMAWATVAGGQASDEVWLDRSFDGGQTGAPAANWATPRSRPARRAPAPRCSTWTTGRPGCGCPAGLRQGRRPPRNHLHHLGPQHLERR